MNPSAQRQIMAALDSQAAILASVARHRSEFDIAEFRSAIRQLRPALGGEPTRLSGAPWMPAMGVCFA